MLFNCYYKSFELLKRYLVKHPPGVDLEKVDKKIEIDETTQPTTTEENVSEENIDNSEGAPADAAGGDEVATWMLFLFYFYFGAQYVFGLYFWCSLYFLGFKKW